MSCENDCVVPPVFPKTIENRPGLARIDYRIGTYASMRAYLLEQLDQAPELAAWTHRGVDDPGIALLECDAVVADILTYYQSLYANEAYLRTAQWRTSIMELVRLLGYRLAPGVGGEGVFAIALRDRATPVTVPVGFGLKAQVGTDTKPADFETSSSITAYAHLSQFRLYRGRKGAQPISAGQNAIEIKKVGGAEDVASVEAFKLKSGDRVMLMPDTLTDPAEMMVVDSVTSVLNRTIVTFKGAMRLDHDTHVTAYKIKRSFGHFGHHAPTFVTSVVDISSGGSVTGSYVKQDPTKFMRSIFGTTTGASGVYSSLAATDMPLDQKVDNLATGAKLVCQGSVSLAQSI
jgi:hypothetical protein